MQMKANNTIPPSENSKVFQLKKKHRQKQNELIAGNKSF